MKKFTILYSSTEIHAKIKKIFSEPSNQDRRVAIVAYVGTDAESYLPHPEGLSLICSPSPGGTDPDTLRRLLKRGATIKFSDKLHMKVYWSRNRGCIITSANASSSALGINGLKEAGVYFPPGFVDIDRLIKYASPRPVQQGDFNGLDRKDREQKKKAGNREQDKDKVPEFLDWFISPHRSKWKLVWAGREVTGTAKAAKDTTFSEYGLKKPHAWASVKKFGVQRNDWILSFMFAEHGRLKLINWVYVDFIVKISPKEKHYYYRDWPYHAIQVYTQSHYPSPPFKITPSFRKALHYAIKEYSRERIMNAKSHSPSFRLLTFIAEEMKSR